MLQTINMPVVSSCAIAECAYNANQSCHAIAITIGDGDKPRCDTFFMSSRHVGVKDTAGVGACKVSVCCHNTEFECGADDIRVGLQESLCKCLTFATA